MANEDIKEKIRILENQKKNLSGIDDTLRQGVQWGTDLITAEIEDLEDELERLGG